jgi:uncharacterized Fe-S cluster-containing radical SAM superfamily protein
MSTEGYDPLELTRIVEKAVSRNDERKYYRFRYDRWYGGIVTADVVGCNLRCGFCWAWRYTWANYDKVGRFYSYRDVCEILVSMARRRGLSQVRVSGGEPTIAFNHLVKLIECVVSEGLHFVLETNGIVIGASEENARKIASFHGTSIEVRVSVKGTSPDEFYYITKAKPSTWWLQLKALELLVREGLEPGDEVYPAVMLSFTDDRGVKRFKRILASIHPKLASSIDPEYVILYRHVEKLLRMTGLRPRKAFRPHEVPDELV